MTAWGLGAYQAATRAVGTTVFGRIIKRRLSAGKEDLDRHRERYGFASMARPEGRLVWFHAASVGESLVALSLAEGLLETCEDVHILITSGTRTSAELIARRDVAGVIHQYVPADAPRFVNRFLDHWQPDLAVFTESELWPNLVTLPKARGIPMALANARMNDKSLKSWRRFPHTAKAILESFDWVGAADDRTCEGLEYLLDHTVEKTGNVKLEAGLPDPDPEALESAKAAVANRSVFLAASTHPGEELIILEALKSIPVADALLILAPRHPDRGDEVAQIIKRAGYGGDNAPGMARRSKGEYPKRNDKVWLADTMGEMALWYAIAPVSLVCGTFLEAIGGHNPIEATRAGSAVVTGPYADSFADVYAAYDAQGARAIVQSPQDIVREISKVWTGEGVTVASGLEALTALPGGARRTTLDALIGLLEGARS